MPTQTTHATAIALLALVTAACEPAKDPGADGADSGSSSSSPPSSLGDSASTGHPADTDAPSTSGTSTSGATGDATTGVDPCPWRWPEYADYEFCPPVVIENAAVVGDTPLGPIDLRFARFGLQLCDECPNADEGLLELYAAAPATPPGAPVGDYITFRQLTKTSAHAWEGRIAGVVPDLFGVNVELDAALPPVEATEPPLDEGAPPLVSGTITLSGPGWAVGGTFSAPLCTPLDWSFACE